MLQLSILSMTDRVLLHQFEVNIYRHASEEQRSELTTKFFDFLNAAMQRELNDNEINEINSLISTLQEA